MRETRRIIGRLYFGVCDSVWFQKLFLYLYCWCCAARIQAYQERKHVLAGLD